jgi:hypothetical protein
VRLALSAHSTRVTWERKARRPFDGPFRELLVGTHLIDSGFAWTWAEMADSSKRTSLQHSCEKVLKWSFIEGEGGALQFFSQIID